MSSDLQDFEQFIKRRQEASAAWTQGYPEPLNQIVARALPATFFGPGGGHTQGADAVASTYEHDSAKFDKGSEFTFETLDMAASDGIGYWVGLMKGTARMKGKSDAIPMELRLTEVFRRENGAWKLVHRHADGLASPSSTDKR